MACVVVLPIEPSDGLKTAFNSALVQLGVETDSVKYQVRPEIICGFKIINNGKSIDLSGKYRLESLTQKLTDL